MSSSSLAIRRVKHRVALGGHDVPSEVVKPRFGRSLHNFFQLYAGVADEWMVFNNSSGHTAQTVAYQTGGQSFIEDKTTWRKMHTLARSCPPAPAHCKKHCCNRQNGHNDWRKPSAKLCLPKRVKKQRSASTHLTAPHSQPTDFNTSVLKRPTLSPSAHQPARRVPIAQKPPSPGSA